MNTAAESVHWIIANLLSGSGLRLLECLRLRVKDIDFAQHQLLIRAGKGNKDRVTLLPAVVEAPLKTHLEEARQLHQRDIEQGFGRVDMPNALERKYPRADREWGWQYVFPAHHISVAPRSRKQRRLVKKLEALRVTVNSRGSSTGGVALHKGLISQQAAQKDELSDR